MKKRIKLAVLFSALVLTVLSLVACGDSVKGEGYEITNQRMEVTASGSDANVTIKGTLTNTLKEEETPVVVYSILDENGKRIAAATYFADDMPAGSSVDFETTLMPILPTQSSLKADDYEMSLASIIGLSRGLLQADGQTLETVWGEVCQAAKSYKLEDVYFTKAEAREAQRQADEVAKQLEQEQMMEELRSK